MFKSLEAVYPAAALMFALPKKETNQAQHIMSLPLSDK